MPHDPPAVAPLPLPAAMASVETPAGRIHLVVVTTRALTSAEAGASGNTLRTRFWHPRDRCWSENDFASLDHARHLFTDESGWTLLQEQPLNGAQDQELVFQAHRIDFSRMSAEEILEEVGLTPDRVQTMLEQVEPKPSSP
jgi:hypothetical protein